MKKVLFLFLVLTQSLLFSQVNDSTENFEYLNIRVTYGKNVTGYKYKLYLDIGLSGSHSLSGQVTNIEEKVIIKNESGQYVFTSDIDLMNYLGTWGWEILTVGETNFLGEDQFYYLMRRSFFK